MPLWPLRPLPGNQVTNTQVPAHRRDQLERLIRYTARGAVSLERLTQDTNGDLVYTFTRPWSDGTTGIRLSPLELLEKLAALVPLPRVHLVRSGACLAPHSHLRGAIIPTPRQQGVVEEATDTGSPRWSWTRRGCSSASLRWTWRAASDVSGGCCVSSPPSRAVRSSGRSSSL